MARKLIVTDLLKSWKLWTGIIAAVFGGIGYASGAIEKTYHRFHLIDLETVRAEMLDMNQAFASA